MKTIKKTTSILLLTLISMAFTSKEDNTSVGDNYLCFRAYNEDAKKMIISNIFQCSEFKPGMDALSKVTVMKYLESEYKFKIKRSQDIRIYTNSDRQSVDEARNKAIVTARNNKYHSSKIEVYCKDGLIFNIN